MSRDEERPGDGLLATVTHARLRAAQGDPEGARRLLRGILRERPGDPEAERLLRDLEQARQRRRDEPERPVEAAPVEGDARGLASRFRAALGGTREAREAAAPAVKRLKRLLERIERSG